LFAADSFRLNKLSREKLSAAAVLLGLVVLLQALFNSIYGKTND